MQDGRDATKSRIASRVGSTAIASARHEQCSRPLSLRVPGKPVPRSVIPPGFAQLAAAGGLAEVDLGKRAESKTANADVKQFDECMIDDHGKADDKLTSIAQKTECRCPASWMPSAAVTTDVFFISLSKDFSVRANTRSAPSVSISGRNLLVYGQPLTCGDR